MNRSASREVFRVSGYYLRFRIFSSIPWIHFTQFTRPISKLGEDAIPRITFGKYEWRDGSLMMPVSTQTHHGLIDGLHIGRFFEGLAKYGNTY